jgi:hypothetical protein
MDFRPFVAGVSEAFKGLKDPVDMACGAIGAAAGLVVTIVLHGTELGASVGAGASGGIALSKGATAMMARHRLRARANGLESALRRRIEGAGPDASLSNGKALEDVQRDLAVERDIWNTDKSPGANDRFSKQLERIENGFRVAVTKKTTTKRHAGSESANVGAANTERAVATEVP